MPTFTPPLEMRCGTICLVRLPPILIHRQQRRAWQAAPRLASTVYRPSPSVVALVRTGTRGQPSYDKHFDVGGGAGPPPTSSPLLFIMPVWWESQAYACIGRAQGRRGPKLIRGTSRQLAGRLINLASAAPQHDESLTAPSPRANLRI